MNNVEVSSGKDRIRPTVIVLVAAAILAAVLIPFLIIRAVWPGRKPGSASDVVRLSIPASKEECVVGIPNGISKFKMSASNGSLVLDFLASNPVNTLTIEIGQGRVLCRSDGGQKVVQGRSLRLTRDGKTVFQGRDGKLTMTWQDSNTTVQAIGDQIHNLNGDKTNGPVGSAHSVEFTLPKTTQPGDRGAAQTRPAA